jgi:riboflavin synthase
VRRGDRAFNLAIEPRSEGFEAKVGGSVAVDGVCLTVESVSGHILYFTAVQETLVRSTLANIRPGFEVNLERALRVSDRFDGHIVLGHVDGVGRIERDERVGESLWRLFSVPEPFHQFLAEKGSVAIDGISLTIARYAAEGIAVALIPHTLGATTMSKKRTGDSVNIECDVLARYIAHRMQAGKSSGQSDGMQISGGSLLDKMEAAGF